MLYAFIPLLGMQALSLFQVDGKQTASSTHAQYQQGNAESEEDIPGNEAEERRAKSSCGNEDETASDAHKLQWQLQAFIDGIASVVGFHGNTFFVFFSFVS